MGTGWRYEGYAWVAADKNSSPVYRLYNPNSGDHHYTTSAGEKNALVKAGWKDEGIGWYSEQKNGKPVYRLYNPHAKTGSHHYTLNAGERNALVKAGWKAEGIGWYAANENTPKDDAAEVNKKYAPKHDYSNASVLMQQLTPAEKSSANNTINAIVNDMYDADYNFTDDASFSSSKELNQILNAVYSVIDELNLFDKTDTAGCGVLYNSDNGRYQLTWCRVDKLHNLYEANVKAMGKVHAFIDPYVHAGMREDQKVRAIHDRIRDYLSYDYSYKVDNWQDALRTHKGMCGAYSELFNACCDACGLKDRIALGDVYENGKDVGFHAWNYVKVNGTWYYLDVTWDDGTESDRYYLSRNGWADHKLSYFGYRT